MDALKLVGVGLRRGRNMVLQDIDLRLATGALCALVGANGAGKSTLLAVVATMLQPDQGSVHILGLDARRQAADIRRQLGVVFQDGALEPRLSVWDNLLLIACCYGFAGAAARSRCAAQLAACGWEPMAGRRVESLSGGQRRQLELMRASLAAPRLLLLDEPTQGLDEAASRAFWQQIAGLRQQGVTVLFSTHRPEEAAAAEQCIRLVDGRLQPIAAATAGAR
jgi:ABC-2 type transport system ATP-binding protein